MYVCLYIYANYKQCILSRCLGIDKQCQDTCNMM